MKVLIDVFGCDYPDKMIDGLAKTVNLMPEVTLVVAGDKEYIEKRLNGVEFDRSRLEFLDAKEVITNDDLPVVAIRAKKNSSLVVALKELRENPDIPVMITGGNTGATFAGAILLLGRNNLEDRPTLVSMLPTINGRFVCISDCGANLDSKSKQLFAFGKHACKFMQTVYGYKNPKVALLSVGTEDKKGNAVTKETFQLFKESELNFCGNVEAKTVLDGQVDVVVCDGFCGNVLLKSIEGTAKTVVKMTIDMLKKHADSSVDLTFMKRAIGELMQNLDFTSMAGSVLIGAKKPIIKAHGSANEDTVVNTVKQAINIVQSGYTR